MNYETKNPKLSFRVKVAEKEALSPTVSLKTKNTQQLVN